MGVDTDPTADADDFIGDGFPMGTVVFAADESTKTITVDVSADSDVEPDEHFKIVLSDATGAAIDPESASAEGLIRNDDTPTAAIGDEVFDDANANGVRDDGEDGIAGVTIDLIADANGNGVIDPGESVVGSDTTDADGVYGFDGLEAGDYIVDVIDDGGVLNGFALTTPPEPRPVTVTDGEKVDDTDFGYQKIPPELAFIGDEVFEDVNGDGVRDDGEDGIAGVVVDLIADANGNGVSDDGDSTVGTDTTDANGTYGFADLAAGDYIVDVDAPSGFTLTTPPEPRPVTVAAGDTVTDADFGYRQTVIELGTIGDFVWNDLNQNGIQDAGEPGLAGVTVELQDSAGNTLASTSTDADGLYNFANLTAGDYRIEFITPDGFDASPRQQGNDSAIDSDALVSDVVTLTAGENNTTIDAGFFGNSGDR